MELPVREVPDLTAASERRIRDGLVELAIRAVSEALNKQLTGAPEGSIKSIPRKDTNGRRGRNQGHGRDRGGKRGGRS